MLQSSEHGIRDMIVFIFYIVIIAYKVATTAPPVQWTAAHPPPHEQRRLQRRRDALQDETNIGSTDSHMRSGRHKGIVDAVGGRIASAAVLRQPRPPQRLSKSSMQH